MAFRTSLSKAQSAQISTQVASVIEKIQVMTDSNWSDGTGWTRVDISIHPGAADLWQWIQNAFDLTPVSVVTDPHGETIQVSFIQEHAIAVLEWLTSAGLIKSNIPAGVSVHYPELGDTAA